MKKHTSMNWIKWALILFFTASISYATPPESTRDTIVLTESDIIIPSKQEMCLHFGFASSDKLIFDLQERDNDKLQEIEIIELPNHQKFKSFKTASIKNKVIEIPKTGIYKFRLVNSSILTKRVAKIKIARIPASKSLISFNSNVFTRTVYDTAYINKNYRTISKVDTTAIEITNQIAKVHSKGNLDGNTTCFNFSLPANTISWSYYIGVDQEGQKAYEKATELLSKNAGSLTNQILGYNPMVALALGASSYLTHIQGNEDVEFEILKNANDFENNKAHTPIKKGTVVNDFSRMSALSGNLYFCMRNNNFLTSINVTVKIVALCRKEHWLTKPYDPASIPSIEEMYLKN